jgi:hypothetical protein
MSRGVITGEPRAKGPVTWAMWKEQKKPARVVRSRRMERAVADARRSRRIERMRGSNFMIDSPAVVNGRRWV